MIAKKGAAAKGFTISAQMLQFILGLGIVIIVLFSLLFYFFRNQSERESEQNVANLLKKIEIVCDSGEPQSLKFNLPQSLGFEDNIRNFIHMSPNVGTDPYFYVYYESFPPEPPYELFDSVEGTVASIIAPWSEDYPWSSNLLLTAALDMATMDLNFGFGKLAKGIKQSKGIVASEISSSESLVNAIKAKKIIVKDTEVVIGELPNFAKYTAALTVLCMAATDENLENCALLSAVGYAGTRAAGKGLKVAFNKWNEGIVNEKNMLMKSEKIKNILDDGARAGDEARLNGLSDEGFIEMRGNDVIIRDPDTRAAIDLMCNKNPSRCAGDWLGEIHIIRTKTGDIGDIILDKTKTKGFVYRVDQFWENFKGSVAPVLHKDVGTPQSLRTIADSFESQPIEVKRSILKQMMREGYDLDVILADDKSVEAAVKRISTGWRSRAGEGNILLIEKNSELAKTFGMLDSGYGYDPKTLFNEYFNSLSNKNFADQQQELKFAYGLFSGKKFRITDKINEVAKGTLGYSLLRIQDQTPLGLTYWNQQVSFYNYPTTPCQSGQICLQYGFYVQKYNLPDSCVNSGVTQVKLKRDSIVAKDPRFYLVSPCFSNLEITKEGDTIYISPKFCENQPDEYVDVPNYCYATSGVVNYYVTTETASFFADCIANVICNALTLTGGGNLGTSAVLACLNVKTPLKYASLCGALGQGARLLLDMSRETVINYPYIPKEIQNSYGFDSRYVGC
ncbi:MAG: hypothetical protein V1944_00305 [Candidatus Aenigmatarchaeota archaeon]